MSKTCQHDGCPEQGCYNKGPATYVEGREAPRPCGHRGLPCECEDRKRATAREAEMLEACARAAYEARYADSLHLRRVWADIDEPTREMWRAIARAVLAAAKGAGR